MWIEIDGDYYNLNSATEIVRQADGSYNLWFPGAASPVQITGPAAVKFANFLETQLVLCLQVVGSEQDTEKWLTQKGRED